MIDLYFWPTGNGKKTVISLPTLRRMRRKASMDTVAIIVATGRRLSSA